MGTKSVAIIPPMAMGMRNGFAKQMMLKINTMKSKTWLTRMIGLFPAGITVAGLWHERAFGLFRSQYPLHRAWIAIFPPCSMYWSTWGDGCVVQPVKPPEA